MMTSLGLVLFVILIVLTAINNDKDYTKILLGIAWFLMFLFPAMTYRHQLGDTAYSYLNHRAYLPMMGMLIFLFSIIPGEVQQKNINMVIIPVAVISVIFGILSKVQTKIYNDSVGFYTSAIEANPQSALCYNNRGKIFADNGELDKSMADFNKALELNPEDDFALSNRAFIEINQKNYRGAITDLREAIRLKPDLAAAYNNMGVSFFNLNQMTESLEAYNKAIELNSNYVDAYSNRALHKFTNHDNIGAIEDYSRAIMLSPSKYVYYSDRAAAYFRVQEFDKACGDWKRAAELGDQNSAQNFKNACQGGAKKILCQGSACH